MEGESTRQLKVAKELQRHLAEIIRSKGMASWDGKVFRMIQESGRTMRGELGRQMAKQLRIIPELIFYLDDSLDYVEHIDELLAK